MQHHFEVEEAQKYGIEEAILLNNLRFWLEKNRSNGKNVHDDYYWTYNSVRAYGELFPYLGEDKVYRALKKLEDLGIVKSGKFNASKYDHTKWYTIPQEYKVDSADLQNQSPESTESFTYINPDIKPNINTDILEKKYSSLKEFESVPKELISYFIGKYNISAYQLQEMATTMILYCQSKGRTYKDYKAVLETWIRKEDRFKSNKINKL